jgi:serine/threonine protein kinase
MTDDERLQDLLLRWEEEAEAGYAVSAEDLCRECPELADELRRRMDALRRVGWLSRPSRQPQVTAHFTSLVPDSEALPGYRLVQRLGRGGFAEVWKANGPHGAVALKFVPQAEQAAGVEWRSVEVLKLIDHPNLLRTYQAWQVEGFFVVAMELADRTLLDRWHEAQAQGSPGIPREELLRYFRQAADAVDFLQKRYIQHRDIKPQNLLLVGDTLKVGDFGLTRLLSHSVTGHTGSLTLAYAAPEFFDGKTTRHSDEYSLAVTYCQMRGGKRPFEGTPAALVAAHLNRAPDLSMLPPEERPAVAKALAKRPAERWPTCRAFVEAVAQPHSPSLHVAGRQKKGGRRMVFLLGGAVALLALTLLLGVLLPQRTPTVTVQPFAMVENGHYIRSAAIKPALPPLNRLVALSNGSGNPLLWDVATGTLLRRLPYEGGPCAALAPLELPLAATGHDDGNVVLWDLKTGKEVRRYTGHASSVSSVAFSPDASRILSGSCDGTLRLWDRETGKEATCLRGHESFVMSVAFDPTGRYALSGSYDGTVRLWDLDAGAQRKRFEGHRSHVLAVAFSPDGHLAASGGLDRAIRVWDTETGREVARLAGHADAVSAVCFLRHNRLIVADGNEVRFLQTPGGEEWLRCPPQPSLVQSLDYTAYKDQLYLVLGTAKDGVRVCALPEPRP